MSKDFTDHEIDTIQTSLDHLSTMLGEGELIFDGQELDWEEVESLRDSLEDPFTLNVFDEYEIDAVLVALDLLIDLIHQEMDLDTNVLTVTEVQDLKNKVATLR